MSDIATEILPRSRPEQPALSPEELSLPPWPAVGVAARCVLRVLPLVPWERVALDADAAALVRYVERVAILAGLTAIRGKPSVDPLDLEGLQRVGVEWPDAWKGPVFEAAVALLPVLAGGAEGGGDVAEAVAGVSARAVEAMAAQGFTDDDAVLDVAAGRADVVWLQSMLREGSAGAPPMLFDAPLWQGLAEQPPAPASWQREMDAWAEWIGAFAMDVPDIPPRYRDLLYGKGLQLEPETDVTFRWLEETQRPLEKTAEQTQRPGAVPGAGASKRPPLENAPGDSNAPPGETRTLLDTPEFFARLSPAARFALRRADQLRLTTSQQEIHMEHLLAGLFAMANGPAEEVLGRAGIDRAKLYELVRGSVGVTLPTGTLPPLDDLTGVPPRSKHVHAALMAAERAAGVGGYRQIQSRHLLAGALSVGNCSVIRALLDAGVRPEWVEPGRPRLGAGRGPVLLAGFKSDDPDGADRLGVQRDVRALAAVIASHEMTPPLSVGLFGDWGTGKTFFMRKLEKEVAGLQDRARSDGDSPWCANIVQLWFNAWHYMDTNLWASLASEIFDGLAVAVARDQKLVEGETDPEAARARLLADTLHLKQVKAEAQRRHAAANRKLEASQDRLEELERAEKEVESELTPRQLARAAYRAAVQNADVRRRVEEVGRRLNLPAVKTAGAEARARLLELEGFTGAVKATWLALRQSSLRLGIVVAGALLIALGALASPALGPLFDRIGGLTARTAAWITGALALLGPVIERWGRVARGALGLMEDARKQHKGMIDAKTDQMRQQLMEERSAIDARVDAEARRIRETQKEIEALEKKIEGLSADGQMRDFIQARRGSEDYRKHLGVISRARNDFERLTDLLKAVEAQAKKEREARKQARAGAPGGGAEAAGEAPGTDHRPLPRIDRIVLYIDDLDRCPESKVVDVLQAVHLLLAFPLFVVVVGVDSRWLLHSLQRHVAAFRKPGENGGAPEPEREHWRSTPLNYLEKIFQIPLTLRPMNAEGFDLLVEDLTMQRDGDGRRGGSGAGSAGGDTEAAGAAVGSEGAGAGSESAAPSAASGEAVGSGAETGGAAEGTTDGAGAQATGGPDAAAGGTAGGAVAVGEAAGGAVEAGGAAGGGSAAVAGGGAESGDTGVGGVGAAVAGDDGAGAIRPELVRIESWERAFMKLLYPLIPTPRATKRFVNVYRLIRASVAEDRWQQFLGDETGGEHRVVLLLLAMVVGFPEEAAELLQELVAGEHDESWPDFVARFRGKVAARSDAEEAAGVADPPGADDEAAVGASGPALRWAALFSSLAHIQKHMPPNQSSEDYLRWAPEVARYSFQSGRALLHR